jgi:hypothetical protein
VLGGGVTSSEGTFGGRPGGQLRVHPGGYSECTLKDTLADPTVGHLGGHRGRHLREHLEDTLENVLEVTSGGYPGGHHGGHLWRTRLGSSLEGGHT